MKEKALETEEQRAKFQRKFEERRRVIWVIGGLIVLIGIIWGNIFFAQENYLANLVIGVIFGSSLIMLGSLSPVIYKRRVTHAQYVSPPPGGWDVFCMSTFVYLFGIFLGIQQLQISRGGTSDFSSFALGISLIIGSFTLLLYAVLCTLPQVNRSFSLFFAGPNKTTQISCWRDENFGHVTKRLCNERVFKKLLSKMLVTPNTSIKLFYHERELNPESTPAQEMMKSRSKITVTISKGELLG